MASSLGSLVVSLGLDAAQFVDGLTKSEYQARNFVRSVSSTMTRVAGTFAVLAGAAAAPIAALRAMTGEMDKVSKAARRASMPTEAFSALAYAGDLADVSMESLVSSMGRLARAQSDALRSATSQQAEAFQRLGIEISNTDGTLRTSSEVFADFADRFEKFGGTPEVIASGMAIFGRSFQEMIPLLSGGARGLQEAAEEAAAFGVVMSTRAGKQAEAFNDNISRLGFGLLGMKRIIVAEMLPAAVTLTDQFVALAKEVTGADGVVRRLADDGTLKDWAQKGAIAIATIAESLVFLGKAAHTVSGSFSAVFADIQVANAASRNMFGGFLFESNRKALSDALEARNKTVADANARLYDLINYDGARLSRSLREIFAAGDFVGPPEPTKSKPLPFALPGPGGKSGAGKGGDAVLRDVEDQAARTRQAVANLITNSEVAASREYALQMEFLDKLFFDLGLDAQTYDSAMKGLTRSTVTFGEDGRKALEDQASAWLDTIDPMREYIRKVEQLDRMLSAGFITPEQAEQLRKTFEDATRQLSEMDEFALEAARNIQDHLGDTLYDAMQGNFDDIAGSFKRMIDRMVAEAAAAQLARHLMGDFGKTGEVGGIFGGVLKAFFGAGSGLGYGTAGTAAASAFVPGPGGSFVPALAGGGDVKAGGFYRVNERRTEMLSINGKDYLMAGAAGRVRPNPQFATAARGGDTHIHLHGVNDFESFRRSETQLALGAGAALSRGRRGG